MKYKKRIMPRIVAGVALFAVVLGILGTGVLVLLQVFMPAPSPEITQEQLQQYIDSLSWTTVTQSWTELNQSWSISLWDDTN